MDAANSADDVSNQSTSKGLLTQVHLDIKKDVSVWVDALAGLHVEGKLDTLIQGSYPAV